MKKEKYIFTRKILLDKHIKVLQSIKHLPITLEDKLKHMGKDYSRGESYKITYPNGDVEVGFDINDTGVYEKALPGQKIKPYAVYDYWGNEVKTKK
ncbi:MAG: hypothetical protein PHC46_04500 [Clostridia bacterium]|nr:hypothetical protein [Clostridia bacterium]